MVDQNREAYKRHTGVRNEGLRLVDRNPCAAFSAEQAEFFRQTLDRVGDKWSLLVMAVLEPGPLRYTELLSEVPGISQRMLTLTLKQLAQDGLVTRTAYREVPPRVEYDLTPLSRSLREIVRSLIDWANDHQDEIRANRAMAATDS